MHKFGAFIQCVPIPSKTPTNCPTTCICKPHLCASCGANVEALGVHGLSCCFSKGQHSRHAALNDILKRTLESPIPCHLEPSGLFCLDGKRPDGASIVPWKGRKVLIWDATCPDTLAPSHLRLAVREAGDRNILTSHPPTTLSRSQWSHWGCSGRRLDPF